MKKILIAAITLVAVFVLIQGEIIQDTIPANPETTEQVLLDAFENRHNDVQVSGEGRVSRILSDDNKGSRHQRFIIELRTGQTVLVSHNIDLAPRIIGLQKGDVIRFNGEYEWNPQGGVVHWTHHDPTGRHIDGWIEYGGKRFQ